ncbi:MAG: sugar ABC transporter ATP-binding protein [Phycisphaerae bacterium]|jgi:ribose transport system ATP-binding protein
MLFEAQTISKSYPGVKALSNIDFSLHEGEVHALIGENGAGKSTLAKIIAGVIRSDAGTMKLSDAEYDPLSTSQAQKQGVRMVMQELNILDTLSIAENIFFDSMVNRCGFINYTRLHKEAKEAMSPAGLGNIAPSTPAGKLSIGQKQMVEIAAGLYKKCKIFILDEPTSSLTDKEIKLLFERIKFLKGLGAGIIYISHKMNEIKQIADRITVLRDGQKITTDSADKLSISEMVQQMVGRKFSQEQFELPKMGTEVILEINDLCSKPKVKNVSFNLHKGEILGIAGLIGSGRTETVRCIFGADRPQSGRINLKNQDVSRILTSPKAAVSKSMAMIPEDRKSEGLLLSLAVKDNISIGNYDLLSSFGFIKSKKEYKCAEKFIDLLNIKCSSQRQDAMHLSGGNQQKVILSRWICRDSDIFIFDEPTRGIDIAARYDIYKLMTELTAKGRGLIVVSSDLQELMIICHRIAVMSNGKLVQTFDRNNWTENDIMQAAFSEYVN